MKEETCTECDGEGLMWDFDESLIDEIGGYYPIGTPCKKCN
ncbi:hypothetical protein LCGC14_0388220 [marine sediment metagenome]|uniref:Uncharacterized protein n=1 Tax=marine sediment metagenome TaxID=412755 RepID=A0A0F9T084_9ZZZZ